MSRETSTESRGKLKPFSEFLKETMSPETWAWFSKYLENPSPNPSPESRED